MNAVRFILAIGVIILTWCVLFAIFCGIGLIIQRLAGRRKFDADHCLMSFWMGFAATIFFLQLLHLKMAVGIAAFTAVCGIGLTGLLWNGQDIINWLRSNLPGKRWPIATMLILTIWLANRSAGPCISDDSGLYHLSGIRWITTYPIVPGLGNLHGRLAFNNASFLYGALLEIGPWYGRSNHLANGLLLTVLGAQCVLAGYRLAQPLRREMAVSLFNFFLLTPLILTAVHSWTSSHNTDPPVAILAFVAAARMLAFLLNGKSDLKEQAYDVIFIITALAAGVCVKISLIFFFLAASLVIVAVWMYRTSSQQRLMVATLAKAAAMTTMLLVPWLVRGIILSGYPVYPSTFGAMPVSWRVPEALTKWDSRAIRGFARQNYTATDWSWVKGWALDLERDIILPVIITVVAVLVLVWLLWKKRRPLPESTAEGWLLVLPTVAAIIFWFITAPTRRFGFFLFWILAGTCLAMLFHRYVSTERQKLRTAVFIVCLVFSLVNIKKFFIMPPLKGWLHATPITEAHTFTTRSGLVLYVPLNNITLCWDMKLPCTPWPQAGLKLRREGVLESGFILDEPVTVPPLKETLEIIYF